MKKLLLGSLLALAAGVGAAAEPAFEELKWEANAFKSGVWTRDAAGVMTASKDQAIWSAVDYEDFILDFDYKLDPAANSGVIFYAINPANWIPGSVELQLLDDANPKWKNDAPYLKNSSLYGHLAPLASPAKPAGEWNHVRVKAQGQKIWAWVNGVMTIDADLSLWTSAKRNPDGTKIPPWLSTPWAKIPTTGRIGFQGMHGGARPYFRNVRVAKIPDLEPYVDGATARTAAYRLSLQLAQLALAPVDMASVKSNAGGFIPAEAPAMAFEPKQGKKLCCDWQRDLTVSCSLARAETVKLYTLASSNDDPQRDPVKWELYASMDGANWQLVDARQDVAFDLRHQLLGFKLERPVTARHFKLVVKQHRGARKVQFSRLTFRK